MPPSLIRVSVGRGRMLYCFLFFVHLNYGTADTKRVIHKAIDLLRKTSRCNKRAFLF